MREPRASFTLCPVIPGLPTGLMILNIGPSSLNCSHFIYVYYKKIRKSGMLIKSLQAMHAQGNIKRHYNWYSWYYRSRRSLMYRHVYVYSLYKLNILYDIFDKYKHNILFIWGIRCIHFSYCSRDCSLN